LILEPLFLLIAACLILLALLFILPPLWRQRPIATAAIDERNIAIAQHRLAELTEQLQTNALNQAQYDEQRAELEQALSDDLDIQKQGLASTSQGRWLAYSLLIILPVLGGSLYAFLGNYKAISPTPEMLGTIDPAIPDQAAINKMVNGLAEKMKTDPSNAEGWLMLGKSYKYLQQYTKAADAYAQAYLLLGDKPDVMLQYADALSYANDEQVMGKAAELAFKALALEPDNPNALWLSGMAKAQAGEFMAAKKLWTKLKDSLPEGSDAQKETLDLLAKIDVKIAESNGEQATQPEPTTANNTDTTPKNAVAPATTSAAVNVQVSLAPELQSQISPDDTLFVYAQATSGPQMPLAIVRKQVKELPLAVSLDDSLAMTPAMKLSNFANVKLLARVSKSGNAMKQAGDLIGVIDDVSLADKTAHTLIINSVVK
jgi:cytochrome c-type biogenesis protein CcmH